MTAEPESSPVLPGQLTHFMGVPISTPIPGTIRWADANATFAWFESEDGATRVMIRRDALSVDFDGDLVSFGL